MNRLEIVLTALLFVSVVLNMGIMMYARATAMRLLFLSEELGDLQNMVNAFADHLKTVYELDAFYGDETLRHLLDHAISLNEQLGIFEEICALTENRELISYDDTDTHEEADNTEDSPQKEKPLLYESS
tara:strand:- start:1156 stop:1542 length:387 start_codon:yes stop_codon:yes gene_type:complete